LRRKSAAIIQKKLLNKRKAKPFFSQRFSFPFGKSTELLPKWENEGNAFALQSSWKRKAA